MQAFLTNFHVLRPPHELSQERTLEWIAAVHGHAEGLKNGWSSGSKAHLDFCDELKKRLFKVGHGTEKVQRRGTHLPDALHENWNEMEILSLGFHPNNGGFKERSVFFDREASSAFEKFYPHDAEAPPHIIHVTCTGYVAPSAAQKLVSKRGWGAKTMVTHAYHMGCYAAIPAIRMGLGNRADIIHTELCTLHMHPLFHETEQLIVQTLFADGLIRYSLVPHAVKGFRILSLQEIIIPDSLKSMSWHCEDFGLRMTIAKEVPVLIARALPSFLETIFQKAGLEKKAFQKALFAVHPGGPKIIEQVGQILNLTPDQLAYSKSVLRDYGNMSSATLPHIWEKILNDPQVPDGTLVVSMAFGPGLTICGGVYVKCGV